MKSPSTAGEFLAPFDYNKRLAERAMDQLTDEQLHQPLDPETNSVAVIAKHVAGNLKSRWTDFLTSDGEKPWRNRDDEFVDTFATRDQLLAYWNDGWQAVTQTLSTLADEDWARNITIRGESLSVPLAIGRSLSHTGYHVGQIVLISRILAGANWKTLTIPRGGSQGFNTTVWGTSTYRPPTQ